MLMKILPSSCQNQKFSIKTVKFMNNLQCKLKLKTNILYSHSIPASYIIFFNFHPVKNNISLCFHLRTSLFVNKKNIWILTAFTKDEKFDLSSARCLYLPVPYCTWSLMAIANEYCNNENGIFSSLFLLFFE